MRSRLIVIGLLAVLSLVAISPLLVDAWFFAPDSAVHLIRLNDVMYQFGDNNFYPRWLSLSCLGKGSPALNFYAPGFYLLTCYLHLLGISLLTSLKVVCFGVFFVGAWGMYLWMEKHVGKVGATLSAALYLFAPYHFLDIYVRGALPEFAALAALPFLFHAMDLSISDDRNFRGIALTALSSASIVLLHNLSAFMIAPFALVYLLWRSSSLKVPRRRVLRSCLGPLLGAGISAFYWLPVIVESKYLGNLASVISGVFQYRKNFLEPADWFNFSWGFEAFEGPPTGMSYQIGYVLLTGIVVAIVALALRKADRIFAVTLLVLGLLGLFMTLSYSSFVYSALPLLGYVQFPWRYLGPATLFLSAFSGFAVQFPPLRNSTYQAAFCAIAIVSCLLLSVDQRKVREQLAVPLEEKAFRMYAQPMYTFATEDEYLPKGVRLSVKSVFLNPLLVSDHRSVLRVGNFERKGARMKCLVSGGEDTELIIPWFNFPGWQAKCDGVEVTVQGSPEGLISVAVPPGNHTVEVWFGTTWPRVAGWIIACLTLPLLIAGYLVQVRGVRFSLRKSNEVSDGPGLVAADRH